jgi:hypothetical protein
MPPCCLGRALGPGAGAPARPDAPGRGRPFLTAPGHVINFPTPRDPRAHARIDALQKVQAGLPAADRLVDSNGCARGQAPGRKGHIPVVSSTSTSASPERWIHSRAILQIVCVSLDRSPITA